jgi:wyosine [tRNA(Phe)-imidazoG37] synthetase (radical SAM superfamily)
MLNVLSGEPLLDSQLVKKIKYAKEKGVRNTYIITNASLFIERLTLFLKSNIISLKV